MQVVDKAGALQALVELDSDKDRVNMLAVFEYVQSGGAKAAE
jgi:hypothetical protein